ncbi:50S ribosomal protein L23 [Candidatus Woesearchaeota archaeon]|nr:50S ribosomal protein L23 [Candidatus Woesearchaeota archaeon]
MTKMKGIKCLLSTEKSMRLMQSDNKLIFVVEPKAKNKDIKLAIEGVFNAKVVKVNTYTSPSGERRAYVKFNNETPAIDVATKLGLM